MTSAYTAASLDYGTSTNIRVVELLQNSSRDPITCKMHVVALDDNTSYTALSYVWGDPTIMREIVVDGKPFHVRENLWNFLNQARQSVSNDFLWIDAICIDQTNIRERNHQVAMMGATYAKATLVVVWLGLGEETIARAIRELSELYQYKRESADWLYFSKNIKTLCVAEYWTRVWIVQEFVLAQRAIIWCGMERLQEEALLWLYQVQLDPSRIVHMRNASSDVYHIIQCKASRSRNPQAMSFISLFEMSERLYCLDARDRVYALLSLVSPEEREQLSIIPDYSKPAPQFFEELYTALRNRSTDISRYGFQGRRLEHWLVRFQKMLALEDKHEVVRRIMAECDHGKQSVDIKKVVETHWEEPWVPFRYLELMADDEPIGEIPEALLRGKGRRPSIQELLRIMAGPDLLTDESN